MPLYQVEVVAGRFAHRHTKVRVSRSISGHFVSCVVRLLDQLRQSFHQQTRMSLSRWPQFRLHAKLYPESTDKRSEMQWRPMKSASPASCPFTQQMKGGVGKPNPMFRGTSLEPAIAGGWKDPEFGYSVSC
jgi:hypothetical protein